MILKQLRREKIYTCIARRDRGFKWKAIYNYCMLYAYWGILESVHMSPVSPVSQPGTRELYASKYRLFWGHEGICDLFTEGVARGQ